MRSRLEVDHVVKRAQGGSDFDLDQLVALCPPCHAQTDAPYRRGRLIIRPLGDGRFTCEVVRGADKWAIRA
jgi:5-methylcytosine-specific restriction endonuclease McrA